MNLLTSISTRIRPSCDANSRQIIPCFSEKRFAQSIYILPVLKTYELLIIYPK